MCGGGGGGVKNKGIGHQYIKRKGPRIGEKRLRAMLGNMKQISKFYLTRQIGENEINSGSQRIHYPTPLYI